VSSSRKRCRLRNRSGMGQVSRSIRSKESMRGRAAERSAKPGHIHGAKVNMTRAQKTFVLLFAAAIGSWGCSQSADPKTSSIHEKRIKAMEAKIDNLASECHAALEAREKAEQRVADLEKEKSSLQKQLDVCKAAAKERDDLQTVVETRTCERDGYVAQLEELKKDIRSILTRVEATLTPSEGKEHKTATGPKL
jgi:septal ring factor EnvC (AmiA/AmiB activator)